MVSPVLDLVRRDTPTTDPGLGAFEAVLLDLGIGNETLTMLEAEAKADPETGDALAGVFARFPPPDMASSIVPIVAAIPPVAASSGILPSIPTTGAVYGSLFGTMLFGNIVSGIIAAAGLANFATSLATLLHVLHRERKENAEKEVRYMFNKMCPTGGLAPIVSKAINNQKTYEEQVHGEAAVTLEMAKWHVKSQHQINKAAADVKEMELKMNVNFHLDEAVKHQLGQFVGNAKPQLAKLCEILSMMG